MNTGHEETIILELIKAFAPDLPTERHHFYTSHLCEQIKNEQDIGKIPTLIQDAATAIQDERNGTDAAKRERAALKSYEDWERVKQYAAQEPASNAAFLYRHTSEAIAHLCKGANEQRRRTSSIVRSSQRERAALLFMNGYTRQSAAQVIFDEDKAKGITNGYPNAEALRQGLIANAFALGLQVDSGKRGRKKQNPAGLEAPAANEAKATRTNAKRKKRKK